MKRIIAVVTIYFLCAGTAHAQTFNEWWRQKKTQKQYLIQQIGLLQVYLGYLKKGYDIVDKGLDLVNDIKNGDFSLHNNYFGALEKVSPSVKQYIKIAGIMAYMEQIQQVYRDDIIIAGTSGKFIATEMDYAENVYTNLIAEAADIIVQLTSLLTDGVYQLKEAERLQRIDALYSDMQDKYAFARSFATENKGLWLSRTKSEQDVLLLQRLHRIK
jgi:hypothetical protein